MCVCSCFWCVCDLKDRTLAFCSTQIAHDNCATCARRDVTTTPPRGAGPQRPSSYLRVQAYQHHGLPGAGRQPFPVPLHHRVFTDLRRHLVRDVEEYLPDGVHAGSRRFARRSRWCAAAHGVQTTPTPLFGGLCARTQGSVRGHFGPRTHHHFSNSVLCAHLEAGIQEPGCHGGQHLRTDAVRHDHHRHSRRYAPGMVQLAAPGL